MSAWSVSGWTILSRAHPAWVAAALLLSVCAEESDPFARAREHMVRADIVARGVRAEATLRAMRDVPRHLFVPMALAEQAYADGPLPIGYGQTISQPYIVAAMTEMLGVGEGDVALEIGAGSGYQAAVLARVVKVVYSIEIVAELADSAAERLARLGVTNAFVRAGDGYHGWPEHAPFDAIIVTAAATHIPPPLVDQLKPGGRMAIPVGPPMMVQHLLLVEKRADGTTTQRNLMPVRFVPLTRGP